MAAVDLDAFLVDVDALRDEIRASAGPDDVAHMVRVNRIQRALALVGLAAAPWGINPIAIVALSLASFVRWAVVAHHVVHGGYDRVEGRKDWMASKTFARGWRRVVDWMDWIHPESWHLEHDLLHHYRLGEDADPDQPERTLEFVRDSWVPMPLRVLFLFVGAMFWKSVYYAPNTMHAASTWREDKSYRDAPLFFDPVMWDPRSPRARAVWLNCFLPYVGWRFVLLPALFLPLGTAASFAVLVNLVLAELLTNVHGFVMIVPNHAGEDVYRFSTRGKGRAQFVFRQVVGSVNYRTGGDLNDLFHGWLNYQIEHHVWPDMTLLQYRRAQPRLQALCRAHGVPYVQEPVPRRVYKTLQVLSGGRSMRWWDGSLSADMPSVPKPVPVT